ncbi:MAG: hypothetical protein C5B54_07275 [Acidobacteria bacterium]|nr:MAG: hypothetical protein C5B54_07275 [Acidobacteriota bacterium]
MAQLLGPTFGDELMAAGLAGIPIAWGPDVVSITGRENLTPAQNNTLNSVIAQHDPTKTAVPAIISRRQFFQAAAMSVGARPAMITREEALDAMRHGAIPPQMQAGLNTLPDDQKFAAEMLFSGANEFERHHPLVQKFGEIMGMTSLQLDDVWRSAATL